MKEEPVLRPEEVAGVLSGGANKNGDVARGPDDGPKPYSLREPVAIPTEAEDAARKGLERIVSALDEAIRAVVAAGFEIGLDDLQQQRTAAALSVLPPPVWVVPLFRENGGGIALALDSCVALALVDRVLGGSGSLPETGREPTPLEARVLTTLVSAAAPGLGAILGTNLAAAACEVGAVPSKLAAPGETVAVGLLRIRIGEGDHASLLLATASLLLPPPEKPRRRARRSPGPLAPMLERVTLQTKPVLRAGPVSLGDLAVLQCGKVLQLDAPEDSILELRVGSQSVAFGRIVRKEDQSVFSVESKPGHRDEEGREQA